MGKQVGCAVTAIIAVTLGSCTTDRRTRSGDADQVKADEVAVRRTLADTERRINEGDLGFVDVFAKDAIIIAPSTPNIIGLDAIRRAYAGALKQTFMEVHFSTEEVAIAGELAYERGTYTLRTLDRVSRRVLQDVKNKHIHILKRQSDGTWKTWRLMTNSAGPASAKE